MNLIEQITTIYPELVNEPKCFIDGTIILQNDSDGKGDYIKEWNHATLTEPTPDELQSIAKPTSL